MADSGSEARIRDLKKRLEIDPGSRLFVSLAEEYRKTRRHAEALSTLQKGLLAHPNYLSAQVALGRAYLEAGQITEAIAAFNKTLIADPGNLVAARSLADIYLSRGESVEAIKKYKLYRALSGDRRVDEIIQKLEVELAPPPPPPPSANAEVPPPPTFFDQGRTAAARKSRGGSEPKPAAAPAPPRHDDSLDVAAVPFEPDESSPKRPAEIPMPGLVSRDTPLLGVSAIASVQAAPVEPQPREAAPALPQPPEAAPAAPPLPEPAPPVPEVSVVSSPPSPAPVESATETRTTHSQAPASFAEAPAPAFPEPEDFATRAFRISEILGTPAEGRAEHSREVEPPRPEEPRGRVLADLYYAQGHFAEALRIYDDLVAANPEDVELKRLRRDAEARLLPAAITAGASAPDPVLARRLAKIRVLKRWLGVVQTG